ncbi:gdsl-like lipase acylhydrolase domain protein [Paraphaeosphaeria minitans]|uniref:Gdsl-like lipase acylhydrolase domain protein n=1 Tax=Paraphaeosphaeria minitans TaxID=565426 RepID=A0A9P6KRD9_9PLEO|nr:gdsl-like lipase acylhydrolase domain protein [Paraphaeosphaeria minitans]
MKQFSAVALSLALLEAAQAVRFLGRVNPATRELTWAGTGVAFSFSGSSATIDFESVTGTNSVLLTVDGKSTGILNVNTSSISTPAGLANGDHTVFLRKRSEALFGSIFVGNVTTDGTFGIDPRYNRKIEFIGDSITVGYGMDGVFPCTNTAEVENNPNTYAVLAANSLKADYDIVAWSGIGLVRNTAYGSPGGPTMVSRWTKYGAQDADNSYTFPSSETPDAVVIALGTNDFSVDNNNRPVLDVGNFTSATVSFIRTVQTHYPKAQFFLVTSPMLGDGYPAGEAQHTAQTKAFTDAAAQLNGTKVHVVDWPSQGSDVGCDYHPNIATNAAEAPILASAIAEALGWWC